MRDRTNYFQSVVHILKGNLGAGILAMPASFKYLGHGMAFLALPLLCLISGYCVHVLVSSSRRVSKRTGEQDLNYSVLARRSFEIGPRWMNGCSEFVGRTVDTALLVTQVGVCCVYIIFVVDNVTSILAGYDIHITQAMTFLVVFPVAIALSSIRTLNRLAIASLIANILQVIGLILIIEYLVRDFKQLTFEHKKPFNSVGQMALGFGSVMFAFEGISVVLPVYNRLKKKEQFGSFLGVINVSFFIMVLLYFIVGLLGYLRYGPDVRDSITLNLPAEPLYDAVRAMFTISILFTYPLQCYVPNELIWEWSKRNLLRSRTNWNLNDNDSQRGQDNAKTLDVVVVSKIKGGTLANLEATSLQRGNITLNRIPSLTGVLARVVDETVTNPIGPGAHKESTGSIGSKVELVSDSTSTSSSSSNSNGNNDEGSPNCDKNGRVPVKYEYCCRFLVVTLTFALAISIPKLNLLMDLVGSFSGTLLCLTLPAMIHLASYWDEMKGFKKCIIVIIDTLIIVSSLMAGLGGSYSSLVGIIARNQKH